MLDTSKLLNLIINMLNQPPQSPQQVNSPVSPEMGETADEVIIALEVPGIQRREDIFFAVGVMSLAVSGFRQRTSGLRANADLEINREKFEREFALPYPVRPETATAVYSKGILEIRLKKLPERAWDKVFVQFL